ncbi:hypothetical protein D3C76_1290800 [compost metagenome]
MEIGIQLEYGLDNFRFFAYRIDDDEPISGTKPILFEFSDNEQRGRGKQLELLFGYTRVLPLVPWLCFLFIGWIAHRKIFDRRCLYLARGWPERWIFDIVNVRFVRVGVLQFWKEIRLCNRARDKKAVLMPILWTICPRRVIA